MVGLGDIARFLLTGFFLLGIATFVIQGLAPRVAAWRRGRSVLADVRPADDAGRLAAVAKLQAGIDARASEERAAKEQREAAWTAQLDRAMAVKRDGKTGDVLRVRRGLAAVVDAESDVPLAFRRTYLARLRESMRAAAAVRHTSMPAEPAADDAGRRRVKLRFPSGKTLSRAFHATHLVQVLFDFVDFQHERGLGDFVLVRADARDVELHDESQTLADAGVADNSVLLVVTREDDADDSDSDVVVPAEAEPVAVGDVHPASSAAAQGGMRRRHG